MARPERNSVDYFPFICNEGNKMYYLEETYGNNGFAVFVKLLRGLATTDYHYLNLSKRTTLMFYSAKCKVPIEKLIEIIGVIVELGKFNNILWEENKIIWCQDLIDSIQDAYNKRKNDCITLEGLLILLDSLGIRKLDKSISIVPVNTQSIVEDSIEKKSIEKHSFKGSPYFNNFDLFKKDIGEIFHKYDLKYYFEKLIVNGEKYTYLDWLEAGQNWILRDVKEGNAVLKKVSLKNELKDTTQIDLATKKWASLMLDLSKSIDSELYTDIYLKITPIDYSNKFLKLRVPNQKVKSTIDSKLLNPIIKKYFGSIETIILTKKQFDENN